MSEKKLQSFEDLANMLGHTPMDSEPEKPLVSIPETKQYLEAHYSNKGRAGKVVTVIKGFEGSDAALKSLAKQLKQHCGVGGSVKDNEIIIQGNYRDQIMEYLILKGHQVKRIGG